MLTVILAVRNTRHLAANALTTTASSIRALGAEAHTEFILIDDDSAPDQRIPELFQHFRQNLTSEVRTVRFKRRGFYTYACSIGFSLARGSLVLFLSHDMMPTPAYLRLLLQVAALDDSHGIVRGCSQHVDCLPQHVCAPPFPSRTYPDIEAFSDYVAHYHRLTVTEDPFLIGDSFLVKRSVLDRIGVMDTRFNHLLGDIDFGLRAQRAGFKLVCAKGAWLHHEGAGHTKDLHAAGQTAEQINTTARQLVDAAYTQFRQKWDNSLPPTYLGADKLDLGRLRARQVPGLQEFQPPLKLNPETCELG